MKKTTFVSLLAICAGSLIILSNSSGPASSGNGNRTGAETGSSVGCAGGGCHTSGTTTTIAIELDSAGVTTTRYKGGMSYTVKITGANTSTSSLPKFGFQLCAIKGSVGAATPISAGTWNTPLPASTKLVAPGAGHLVTLLEQSARINATTGTGGAGTTYVQSFSWTAPVSGSGTISFWCALNAVNGSGSGGDKFNTNHVVFQEWPLGTGVDFVRNENNFNLSLFPNPITTQINLVYKLEKASAVAIKLFDITGKMVLDMQNGTVDAGEQRITANTSALSKGVYFINLNVEGIITTKKIIIQ